MVLPFWDGDHLLAIHLLNWLHEIEGTNERHQCLLVGTKGMTQDKFSALHAAAKRAFSKVFFIQTADTPEAGWPMGPNAMFRTAADYIEAELKTPWFWCEPDVTILRAGALDKLEADYAGCGRPFMGTRFDHPIPHLTGVAVYPPNIRSYTSKMLNAHTKPFDVIDAAHILKQAHLTPLIQHQWGSIENNIPPTFPDFESLKTIMPDALVFHRCKDGSLIKRLRERSGRRHYNERGRLETCIVQLGRYGDIMNVLPIARYIARNYAKPYLMVATEFMNLLEGVSYVIPVEFKGDYFKVEDAIEEARSKHEHVINSMVYGETWRVPISCASYNQESWRVAGYLDRWADPKFQVVFDKRNATREAKLIRQNVDVHRKKVMLINLSGGHSGPFTDWQVFQSDIVNRHRRKWKIIDLSTIIAVNIYDLLGLFDRADLLLTIDTATLHLSAASEVPVIALLNDKTAWNMTLLRKPAKLAVPYSQGMKRIDEIHAAIENL